jgi:hypothetical protein
MAGLVVVNNGPAGGVASLAEMGEVEILRMPANVGPAGGMAHGFARVLELGGSDDLVVALDDDDPPWSETLLEELEDFAGRCRSKDPSTAGVGIGGCRFDPARGRMIRPTDAELACEALLVDHLAGNALPLYGLGALKAIGWNEPRSFFGFEELELCLRLRSAGFSLYGRGGLRLEERRMRGRLALTVEPSRRLPETPWRHYYSTHNLIWILRRERSFRGAVHVSARVLLKALADLPRHPVWGTTFLTLSARACIDGWTGRLGRRVEPSGYG